MNCTETLDVLQAYVDSELDPLRAAAVEQHLHACADCSGVWQRQRSLRSAIREHADYFRTPDALRRRIGSISDREVPKMPAASHWAWLRFGGAMAFTALITWTITYQSLVPSQSGLLADQIIASHARSLLENHLVDVSSSDQHTVKPWLSSRLSFSPPVVDLTVQGFPLVGARLDYLAGQPVAVLVYRHRQHFINLFIRPADSARHGPTDALSKRGYNLLMWGDMGMEFRAVSDLNPADMKAFADIFAAQRNP